MLAIKLSSRLFFKLEHSQVGDGELLFCGSNHFSEVNIGIGFEHAVGSGVRLELLIGGIFPHQLFSCEFVSKGHDFELAIEAGDNISDVEVRQFDFRVLYLFEEYFVILDVVLHKSVSTISIWLPGTK